MNYLKKLWTYWTNKNRPFASPSSITVSISTAFSIFFFWGFVIQSPFSELPVLKTFMISFALIVAITSGCIYLYNIKLEYNAHFQDFFKKMNKSIQEKSFYVNSYGSATFNNPEIEYEVVFDFGNELVCYYKKNHIRHHSRIKKETKESSTCQEIEYYQSYFESEFRNLSIIQKMEQTKLETKAKATGFFDKVSNSLTNDEKLEASATIPNISHTKASMKN